jgi:hypothetical protein
MAMQTGPHAIHILHLADLSSIVMATPGAHHQHVFGRTPVG